MCVRDVRACSRSHRVCACAAGCSVVGALMYAHNASRVIATGVQLPPIATKLDATAARTIDVYGFVYVSDPTLQLANVSVTPNTTLTMPQQPLQITVRASTSTGAPVPTADVFVAVVDVNTLNDPYVPYDLGTSFQLDDFLDEYWSVSSTAVLPTSVYVAMVAQCLRRADYDAWVSLGFGMYVDFPDALWIERAEEYMVLSYFGAGRE
jgi:hypothetical protein